MVSEDGSFSMEYQDIKPGKVEDSLFEPPQGYQQDEDAHFHAPVK